MAIFFKTKMAAAAILFLQKWFWPRFLLQLSLRTIIPNLMRIRPSRA